MSAWQASLIQVQNWSQFSLDLFLCFIALLCCLLSSLFLKQEYITDLQHFSLHYRDWSALAYKVAKFIQMSSEIYIFTEWTNLDFVLVLTPGDCLEKSLLRYSWQVFKVACHCLLLRAEKEWLAKGHPAGFVLKAGLKLTVSWSLAWCLSHYAKLTLWNVFVN